MEESSGLSTGFIHTKEPDGRVSASDASIDRSSIGWTESISQVHQLDHTPQKTTDKIIIPPPILVHVAFNFGRKAGLRIDVWSLTHHLFQTLLSDSNIAIHSITDTPKRKILCHIKYFPTEVEKFHTFCQDIKMSANGNRFTLILKMSIFQNDLFALKQVHRSWLEKNQVFIKHTIFKNNKPKTLYG